MAEIKNLEQKIKEMQHENFKLMAEKKKSEKEEAENSSRNQLVEKCKQDIEELKLKLSEKGCLFVKFVAMKNYNFDNLTANLMENVEKELQVFRQKRLAVQNIDAHLCCFEKITDDKGIIFDGNVVQFIGKTKINNTIF